ncbi:MAG: hypothetical protein QF908_02425 [Dehalococcoidia bacterium]|nr:hypothetical protein [Chloroflexota bacterium]MDP7612818.1 hypothetical protein [Dehalococcoidia bacterium]
MIYSSDQIINKLRTWDFKGIGLHPEGSNYVFLARLEPKIETGEKIYAIYKPIKGERPLIDFKYGSLHNREKASWLISRVLGWPNLPPVIVRDGPHGLGSVQLYIQSNHNMNYFTERDARLSEFIKIAMFDVLTNNADRKGGSCLFETNTSKIWAIDQGLTFNFDTNIRTVMFEFIGVEYPEDLIGDICNLVKKIQSENDFSNKIRKCLEQNEIDGLITRVKSMSLEGKFPLLNPSVNVPWPLL